MSDNAERRTPNAEREQRDAAPIPPKAILYDHDGTLVDSLAVVVAATNDVLVANGAAPAEAVDIVARMVLPTAPRVGSHLGVEDPTRQRALAEDYYAAAMGRVTLVRAYPGILSMLEGVASRGLPQAVVSNNQGHFVRRAMEHLGLARHCVALIGEEDMPAHKPDPSGLLVAAQRCGVPPADCWFVGDSPVDARAAVAAGMRPVGVTWGTHTRSELLAVGFAVIIDHPAELLAGW